MHPYPYQISGLSDLKKMLIPQKEFPEPFRAFHVSAGPEFGRDSRYPVINLRTVISELNV